MVVIINKILTSENINILIKQCKPRGANQAIIDCVTKLYDLYKEDLRRARPQYKNLLIEMQNRSSDQCSTSVEMPIVDVRRGELLLSYRNPKTREAKILRAELQYKKRKIEKSVTEIESFCAKYKVI